jgi:hypothetical protein
MGLPTLWGRITRWLEFNGIIPHTEDSVDRSFVKKCPEVLTRGDYSKAPDAGFWKTFPTCSLPEKAFSRIFVEKLEEKLTKRKDLLLECDCKRGVRCIKNLREGAEAFQKTVLPPCFVANAPSAIRHGVEVTDAIACWVKAGFAAGPFDSPPLENFRVNSLIAIPQGPKVRPVLNVSLPQGKSLNSNVKENKLEKVSMCSARCFSYSIMDAGRLAWMTKPDWCDAYKNIPCKLEDLRLQGFYWQTKFFVETRQIFGAKASVSNFDILGNTVLKLVLSDCGIPPSFVHRQLDDIPGVVPFSKKHWCSEFIGKYKGMCQEMNIRIADDCPNCDKAFSLTHVGKVLGIIFDTGKLCWRYPDEKKRMTIECIRSVISSGEVNLLTMQKLMGRLNDLALMCPFLKTFKAHLNAILSRLQSFPASTVLLDVQCISDLYSMYGQDSCWIRTPGSLSAPDLVPHHFHAYLSLQTQQALIQAQKYPQRLVAAALVFQFLAKFVSLHVSSGRKS